MQVARPFPEGDRIHAITTGELLHEPRSLLHRSSPGIRFLRGELKKPANMSAGIEQQPACERRRVRMVAKNPMPIAADLKSATRFGAPVQIADAATSHVIRLIYNFNLFQRMAES